MNTVTLWFAISVIKAETDSANRTAKLEDGDADYHEPPNFTNEQVDLTNEAY